MNDDRIGNDEFNRSEFGSLFNETTFARDLGGRKKRDRTYDERHSGGQDGVSSAKVLDARTAGYTAE